VDRQGTGDQAIPERFPLEQLHREEGAPLVFVDVEDRADVGMLKRGGGPRLALEALESFGVFREIVRQELQGDAPPELQILRLVDDSHAAAAELAEDPVVRDSLADHRRISDSSFRPLPSAVEPRAEAFGGRCEPAGLTAC
jgi:hypothetical protein